MDGTHVLNFWSTPIVNKGPRSRVEFPAVESEFASRLREERQRAGLTKTALAKPRYTVSYISQIEAGRRTPSPEAMAYLAERLGITPSFLSTGVPDGLQERLRFHLEDARLLIRDGRLDDAEALVALVREDAGRYGLERELARSKVVAAQVRMLTERVREAIGLFEEAMEADLPEHEVGAVVASLGR